MLRVECTEWKILVIERLIKFTLTSCKTNFESNKLLTTDQRIVKKESDKGQHPAGIEPKTS